MEIVNVNIRTFLQLQQLLNILTNLSQFNSFQFTVYYITNKKRFRFQYTRLMFEGETEQNL